MTIQVQHTEPAVVRTSEIKLPFFYTCGTYSKTYCCITEDMVLINVRCNERTVWMDSWQFDNYKEIAVRLEKDMGERQFTIIDESVFQHQFSAAHREIFYKVNSELRPKS